jgi:hypothetical protein
MYHHEYNMDLMPKLLYIVAMARVNHLPTWSLCYKGAPVLRCLILHGG